jgi:hypothetical protein
MSDGLAALLLGMLLGAGVSVYVCLNFHIDTIDARCSTACAPMVGDDREGECQCATEGGWKPLREVKP